MSNPKDSKKTNWKIRSEIIQWKMNIYLHPDISDTFSEIKMRTLHYAEKWNFRDLAVQIFKMKIINLLDN